MKFRGLALVLLTSCGIAWAAAPDAATAPDKSALTPIVAGEKAAVPHVSGFAPMAYFDANCARCHGENGSFYGDDFAKDKTDDGLRQSVEEMAEGPAQAPLAPAELEIVTAFHRALRDKKPFVVIVKAERNGEGWHLGGEISPDATLQINGQEVEVNGSQWTAQVETSAVQLRAAKGDATTQLDADAAAFGP